MEQLAYAGVGSRETPEDVGALMREAAYAFAMQGYRLNSGGAPGADSFFEAGWWDWFLDQDAGSMDDPMARIFLPWSGFEGKSHGGGAGAYIHVPDREMGEAYDIASVIHPAWNEKRKDGTPILTRAMKNMHGRNCFQVLGRDLASPVKFLLCWAPWGSDGFPKGGTRTAYVLAHNHGIPCYNLIDDAVRKRIEHFVSKTL